MYGNPLFCTEDPPQLSLSPIFQKYLIMPYSGLPLGHSFIIGFFKLYLLTFYLLADWGHPLSQAQYLFYIKWSVCVCMCVCVCVCVCV